MSIVELPELTDDTVTTASGPRRARAGASPAHARHSTLLMDEFDDDVEEVVESVPDAVIEPVPFATIEAIDMSGGPQAVPAPELLIEAEVEAPQVEVEPEAEIDAVAVVEAPLVEAEPEPEAVIDAVADIEAPLVEAEPEPDIQAEGDVADLAAPVVESAPESVATVVEHAMDPAPVVEHAVDPAPVVEPARESVANAVDVEPTGGVVDPGTGESGPVWEGAAKYADGATDPIEDIWAAPATDNAETDDAGLDELELLQAAAAVEREPSQPLDDPNAELSRLMDEDLVMMVYQPITSLLDDSVVGYEALARGPEDSQLATPAAMFSTAENNGRLNELDMHCQTAAVLQARDVLLKSGHALFVNAEPSLLADAAFGRDPEAAERLTGLLANMTSSCPVVLEIRDRHPYASAAELLGIVMWARGNGFRIALDDVSVHPQSLSLLPLLEPDVIKLDRWVLTADHDAGLGLLLNALRMQAERTGAAIVAQGIETPEDRERALAFGATHIQGFGVGLPAELSEAPLRIRSLEPVRASYAESAVSPFDLVSSTMSRRTGDAGVLSALTLDLENQAGLHSDAILLSNFESGIAGHEVIAGRYRDLAEKLEFVVLLNEQFGPLEGLYTGHAESNDPMCIERSIVVLTPHFSAALLARRSGAVGSGDEFTFTITYDRGLVTRAARMLLAHVDA